MAHTTTHTLASITAVLTRFVEPVTGETQQFRDYTDFIGQYLSNGQLQHFKAGVNAAWREGYDLSRDEQRYEAKHGKAAGDAFSDGFVFAASYL